MKSEDFKELQDFCEQKGYQLLNESLEDNTKFFVVSKKKERIKVEWNVISDTQISFRISRPISAMVMPELASCLESYLNGETPDFTK